jgi:GT2 family glycosyltransferase
MQSHLTIGLSAATEPGVVSVIIPTYNRAAIVGAAIESALRQRNTRLQIIVVDDGSTDDTRAVVDAFGGAVRYVSQENAGVAAARNTGLRLATGEFVAFLDSDDAWLPWKVEAEVAALRAHTDAVVAWTDMSAVDARGDVVHERFLRRMYGAYAVVDVESLMPTAGTLSDLIAEAPHHSADAPVRVGDLAAHIFFGNLLHTSAVLLRRSCLDLIGGFNPAWGNGGEDYEFYTRLCALGPAILIDAPAVRYRVGAADQLTAPEHMLHIAERNLATLRARLADAAAGRFEALARSAVRERLAASLGWVGSAELEAGHRTGAARHLAESLVLRPRVDRRLLLLACCLPPTPWFIRARNLYHSLGLAHHTRTGAVK